MRRADWQITVVCLSFGERGESAKLWREPGMTLEKVKSVRKEEAVKAAEILGARTIFMDAGDYPMRLSENALNELVQIYRDLQPEFVLTHSLQDPYNFDHPLASHFAQEARIVAQAHGHEPGRKILGAPPVFPIRAAPAGTMRMEAASDSGHHAGVGKEILGVPSDGGAGTSLGILRASCAAAWRAGRAELESQDEVWMKRISAYFRKLREVLE